MVQVYLLSEARGLGKEVLGGKGFGLVEMAQAGFPVPPAFIVPTEACRAYLKEGAVPGLEEAVAALKEALLPLAFLVTPNRMEAERLLGSPIRDLGDAEEAAMALLALGPKAVLLKGGHLPGAESVDLLATGEGLRRFSAPRVATRNTHGTGCTLSAAIAAHLALGRPLEAAVLEAKAYLTRALESAPSLGHGHGPLNHFA